MARRTRHVPHQSKLSVQDVRDYSTPEGASMANEEMRRLAFKVDQLREQVEPAAPSTGGSRAPIVQAGTGGGAGGPTGVIVSPLQVWNRVNADAPSNKVADVNILDFDDQGALAQGTPVSFEVVRAGNGHAVVRGWVNAGPNATSYWFARVNSESVGYKVNPGSYVNFIAGENIVITRQNANITISAPNNCFFTIADDIDSMNVGCQDLVEFIGSGTLGTAVTPNPGGGGGYLFMWNFLSVDTDPMPYYDDVIFQHYPNVYEDTGWQEVAFSITHEPYWKPIYSHPAGGINKTKAVLRAYVPTAGSSSLQLQDDGVNVGSNATGTINFDSNSQTSTDVAVNFQVFDDGGAVRRIRAFVPAGGGYSWGVYADSNPVHTVNSGTNVRFVSGTGVSLSQSTSTITINRPLSIKDDTVLVGDTATVSVNFDSNGQTATSIAVNFVVTDDGSGQRTVKAYIPSSAGTYSFNVSVNGGTSLSVNNGDTLDFSATNGTIVWNRTGLNLEAKSPLTILDDTVAVGGDDTVEVNYDSNGQTTTAVAVNFVVTDNTAGRRTIKAYVPAGGAAYDWRASDGGAADLIASGETVTWTGGPNITVSYNSGSNTFTISNTYSYSWVIKANGEVTGATVSNGQDVDIQTENDIGVRRVGRVLTIYRSGSEPDGPNGGTAARLMMGYIEIDNADEVGKPAWRYGHRKYVDIEHGWNLKNMHAYTLRLSDVALDADGILSYYRSGDGLVNGEDADPHPYQTFPMYSAVDGNKIRVWATQSRLKPTVMRYWFVLRGV